MNEDANASPRAYPHPKVNAAWLALTREQPLDPWLPIIDAHHHLWDRAGEAYLLDHYLDDIRSGHDVRGSVFIQCGFGYAGDGPPERRPVGETGSVVAMLEAHRRETGTDARVCQAIVGHADLTLGASVQPVLEGHLQAGRGRFRGIRHSTSHDAAIASTMVSGTPVPGMLGQRGMREGLRRLALLDLSFDAWLYHPQIDELVATAQALPDLRIVVDHVGGPLAVGPYRARPQETFAAWRDAMKRLAACPNVFVKLGGLARPVAGFHFHHAPAPLSSQAMAEAWRPHVDSCLEAFGARRAMFESNFPVDKGLCSYVLLWNAFKRLAATLSAQERHAVFFDTARRFYRMDVTA